MKKKMFIGLAGLAIVAAAAFTTVSTLNANSTPELSDLMVKNLEVLTQSEEITGANCSYIGRFDYYPDGCGEIEVYTYGCTGPDGAGGCMTGYEIVEYSCLGDFRITHSDSHWTPC